MLMAPYIVPTDRVEVYNLRLLRLSKPLPVISRPKAENFAKVSLAIVLRAGYNLQT